jgi:SHS2 domain-containing protein
VSTLEAPTGHRSLSRTGSVLIEAWAPTRSGCFAEAVRALVDRFADTTSVVVTQSTPLRIEAGSDTELLATLLEEVVFLREVFGLLPAGVVVDEALDGGLGGTLDLAPLDGIKIVGPAPRAVCREELEFAWDGELWACRARVQV